MNCRIRIIRIRECPRVRYRLEIRELVKESRCTVAAFLQVVRTCGIDDRERLRKGNAENANRIRRLCNRCVQNNRRATVIKSRSIVIEEASERTLTRQNHAVSIAVAVSLLVISIACNRNTNRSDCTLDRIDSQSIDRRHKGRILRCRIFYALLVVTRNRRIDFHRRIRSCRIELHPSRILLIIRRIFGADAILCRSSLHPSSARRIETDNVFCALFTEDCIQIPAR